MRANEVTKVVESLRELQKTGQLVILDYWLDPPRYRPVSDLIISTTHGNGMTIEVVTD